MQASFVQNQLENAEKKPRGRRYTIQDKVLAMYMHRQSYSSYKKWSTLFPMPSRTTLERMLRRVPVVPGINRTVLSVAKAERRLLQNPMDKACVLMFDEMSIRPNVQANLISGSIEGFEHFGSDSSANIANHALVFMIRMIKGRKRKQPVAFYFINGGMKSDMLLSKIREVIVQCQEAGLNVVATVCDQGANNQAAINKLVEDTVRRYQRNGVELRGYYFEVGNQRVIPLFDVPHIFKCLRNNLVKYDLNFTLDGLHRTAKWSHIVTAYMMDPYLGRTRGLKKITAAHVLPGKIDLMKVSRCTQVFSASMSSAICHMTHMAPITASDGTVLQMEASAIGTSDLCTARILQFVV